MKSLWPSVLYLLTLRDVLREISFRIIDRALFVSNEHYQPTNGLFQALQQFHLTSGVVDVDGIELN